MHSSRVKLLQQLKYYQQFLRNQHTYRKNFKRAVNDPGISARKSLVNDDKEFQELSDYDFDLEADFGNVGQTHKEHEREKQYFKEREKYLIVKEKYFKEKLPNFLTWGDKEQIRYLHKTDPEEWTIEKLSEGFPALPHLIAKIIKSTWVKKGDKIKNHDEAVRQNWKEFKDGSLKDLPPDLVGHLKKFTDRDLNLISYGPPDNSRIKTQTSSHKVRTEFVDIIKSYERLKSKDTEPTNVENNFDERARDAPLLLSSSSKNFNDHMTLEKYTDEVKKDSHCGSTTVEHELMLQTIEGDKESNSIVETIGDLLVERDSVSLNGQPSVEALIEQNNKYAKSEVSSAVTTTKNFDVVEYPERIRIPKKLYKSGLTFKVNDCYYDDDGEFLYRVPGMYK